MFPPRRRKRELVAGVMSVPLFALAGNLFMLPAGRVIGARMRSCCAVRASAYNGYWWRVRRRSVEGLVTMSSSSIIPILVSQKMIRDSARRQATLADEYCEETQAARACDDEDSAGNLFGMGLFVGLFAVGFGCAAVRDSGWFPWVGVAVFALLSGLMFFASYRLFKGEGEDGSEDSGSES